MNNFFVSGASGLLSINFFLKNFHHYKFTGALHQRIIDIKLKNLSLKKINLFNRTETINILKKIKPDFFLHNAAITDLEFCEKNKEICNKVNYELTKNIVEVCKELNLKLIYISSDQLYSGINSSYKEEDETSPINSYGISKVKSENYIIKHYPNSIIIRTNFFGWGTSYRQSFSDRILNDKNTKTHVLSDVYFNPVYVSTLINLMSELLNLNFKGIINISSDEPLSKYTLAKQILAKFEIDKSIQPIYLNNLPDFLKRPKNMVLDNSKIKNLLKINFLTIRDCIENLKIDKKNGFADIIYKI